MVEDVGGLGHLHHEGRHARGDVVVRADPREDAVGQPDDCTVRRDKASALRQQDDHRGLAEIGRFTGHVGTREDDDLVLFRIQLQVVGHEDTGGQALLDQRVPTAFDAEPQTRVDLRAAPAMIRGGHGQAEQGVDHADRVRAEADGCG